MKSYLYLQYKKYFKSETARIAAKQAAKYYFLLKPSKTFVDIHIKDITTKKIYYYIISKNGKIKRKIKGGTEFTDGQTVLLLDVNKNKFLTAYDPSTKHDNFYRIESSRHIVGKNLNLTDNHTDNSIFTMTRRYTGSFKNNFTFTLKNHNGCIYRYLYIHNTNKYVLSDNVTYAYYNVDKEDDTIVLNTYRTRKIKVIPILPNLFSYLRDREIGQKLMSKSMSNAKSMSKSIT